MSEETTVKKKIQLDRQPEVVAEAKVPKASGSTSPGKLSADKKANEADTDSSWYADTSKPVCRICFRGANEECGPLVSPCFCKGSMGLTHKACIERWLRVRNTDQCNVCLVSMNVRRTKAPLYKFFGDPEHRKDVTRMAINLLACLCDVLILALAWTYAADYLARQGWFLYTLVLAALIFQTLFWILVELVRLWTCYIPLRAWRNKNASVQLLQDEYTEVAAESANLHGRATQKAGPQKRLSGMTLHRSTIGIPLRRSLSMPTGIDSWLAAQQREPCKADEREGYSWVMEAKHRSGRPDSSCNEISRNHTV